MKKDIFKTTIIFLVTVGAVFWALNYIFLNKQAPRSKAGGETIDVVYDPTTTTVAANQDFPVTVRMKPSVDVTVRGYYVKIPFDTSNIRVKSIEYKLGAASSDLGNTNSDVSSINQKGILELSGEVQSNTGQLVAVSATGTDLVKITFTASTATGTSFQAETKVYIIASDGTISDTLIAVPKYDINGGGALITPGVTITGTQPIPPPDCTTCNVKLNLKLKFQGIGKKPADSQNSMVVKVKLKKEGTTSTIDSQGTFTADDNGNWSGVAGFNISEVGGKWIAYVKGPQHLQKKICESVPTETNGGTYRCGNGNITLTVGDNNFDFTKIVLLVGDLDQNGIVDSVDLGLIKNNLGKADAATLAKADLNRDGRVDTQDFSLILAALAVRTDEL